MFSPDDLYHEIEKISVEKWITSLRRKDYQPSTIYSYTNVLKRFLDFLFEYDYIPTFRINRDLLVKPDHDLHK